MKRILKDWSTWSLIGSNLFLLIFYLKENSGFVTLLWIYWFQSVIIGIFNFIRILKLDRSATEGVRFGEKTADPTLFLKIFLALFFVVHYGLFHLGYAVFLLIGTVLKITTDPINITVILISTGLFFGNHLFSFIYNKKKDKIRKIGKLMALPYLRIVPMHLIIILGFFLGGAAAPLFILLKTVADVVTHIIEHK